MSVGQSFRFHISYIQESLTESAYWAKMKSKLYIALKFTKTRNNSAQMVLITLDFSKIKEQIHHLPTESTKNGQIVKFIVNFRKNNSLLLDF